MPTMRLKLQIRRPDLATTRIWWDTTQCLEEKPNATVGHLLQYINEVCPLDYDSLGLEDYVLEKDGYEFVHYQQVGGILRDGDEILIRPLSSPEMRERQYAGRSQINANGRKVLDGIPFGGHFRRPVRTIGNTPASARKLRRLAPPEEDKELVERPRQAVVRFADANFEDSDEDYASEEIEEDDDKEEQEFVDDETDEEMEEEELDEDELIALQRGDEEEVRQATPETATTRQKRKREGHNLSSAGSHIPITPPTVLGKRPHPSSDSASDAGMRYPAKRIVKSVSPVPPLEDSNDNPQKSSLKQQQMVVHTIGAKVDGDDDDDEDDDEFVPNLEEKPDSDSDTSEPVSDEEENAVPSGEDSDEVEEQIEDREIPLVESKSASDVANAETKSKKLDIDENVKSDAESSEESSGDSSDSSDSDTDSDSDSDSDSGSGDSDSSDSSDSDAEEQSRDNSDASSSSSDSPDSDGSEGSDEEKEERRTEAAKLPGPTKFVSAATEPTSETKTTTPPHAGNSKTRYRNARKKKRQQLLRLIQQGLLPAGSTIATLNAVQNLVTSSRTIKDACQIYLARQDGSIEGSTASQVTAKATVASMAVDPDDAIEMQRHSEFSCRNSLLEEPHLASARSTPQKTTSAPKHPNADEKSFIMANAKYATNKKKGFLRKMAGRERSYQKFDEDGNPVDGQDYQGDQSYVPEREYYEEEAGISNKWKEKITLSAVEVGQGYEEEEIPAPTFPFQHPFLQMKGRKGKKGRKQNRDSYSQQEYYDESMYDDSYYAKGPHREESQPEAASGPVTEDLPPLPTDISALPKLTEENVNEGMVICYKRMELDKNYQPIIADYKTALINSVIPDKRNFPEYLGITLAKRDQTVQEIDPETGEPVRGKFELLDEELVGGSENVPGYLELEFSELIEPKILKEPEFTLEQRAEFEKVVEWPKVDGQSGNVGEKDVSVTPEPHSENNKAPAQAPPPEEHDVYVDSETHDAQVVDFPIVGNVEIEVQNARKEPFLETEEADDLMPEAQLVQEAVEWRSISSEPFQSQAVSVPQPDEPEARKSTLDEAALELVTEELVARNVIEETAKPTLEESAVEVPDAEEPLQVFEYIAVEGIEQVERTFSNVDDYTAPERGTTFPTSYQPPSSSNKTTTMVETKASEAPVSAQSLARPLNLSMESKETDNTTPDSLIRTEELEAAATSEDVEDVGDSQECSAGSGVDSMEIDELSEDDGEELQERYADSSIDEDYVGSPVASSNDEFQQVDKAPEQVETESHTKDMTPISSGQQEQEVDMKDNRTTPTLSSAKMASESPFKKFETPMKSIGPSMPKSTPQLPMELDCMLTSKRAKSPAHVPPETIAHSTPPSAFQSKRTPTPKKSIAQETPEIAHVRREIAKAGETLTGMLSLEKRALLNDDFLKRTEDSGKSRDSFANVDSTEKARNLLMPFGGIARRKPKCSPAANGMKDQKRRSLPSSTSNASPKRSSLFDSPFPSKMMSPPRKNRPFKVLTDKESSTLGDMGSTPPKIEQPLLFSQSVPAQSEQAFISSSPSETSKLATKARRVSTQSSFVDPTSLDPEFSKYRDYTSSQPTRPFAARSRSRESKANTAPSSSAPTKTSDTRKVEKERISSSLTTPMPLATRLSTDKAMMIDLTQVSSDEEKGNDKGKPNGSFLGHGTKKKRTSIGGRPGWTKPGQGLGQARR